jgi:hypothetical protein
MLVSVPPITHGHFTYKSNDNGALRQTVCLSDLLDKPLEYYKDLENSDICIITNTFAQDYEVHLPLFNIKFNTVWLNYNQTLLYNAKDYLQPYYISKHDGCKVCYSSSYVFSTISHAHKYICSAYEKQCVICKTDMPNKYYQLINGELHNTILCINCKEFSDNRPVIAYTKMRKENEYTIYYQDTSELRLSSLQSSRYSFERIIPLMEYLPRDLVKFVYSILVLMPTITNLIL